MSKLSKDYIIPFIGLKEGKHHFEYNIQKEFFDLFNFEDFEDSNVKVAVEFTKKATLLELDFKIEGSVTVPCDISNELYNQPIESEFNVVVKFGDEFNNDHDEILILPHNAYEVDVSHLIYESIILAVPAKRIHPGIEDGSLETEILDKLNELAPDQTGEKNKSIDPRWDKLKNFITDK